MAGLAMQLNSLRAIFLGEVDVPAEHRDAIGAARRRAFHALAPMAAIHSLLNAVVLTIAFWDEPAMPLVFVWTYTSAVLVFIRTRESRRVENGADGAAEELRIKRHTLFSGALWGAIIAALMMSSGPENTLLLGVLTAAILCVAIPVFAFLFIAYALYAYLVHEVNRTDIGKLLPATVLLILSVVLAANGASIAVCLLVLLSAPVVFIVYFVLIGWRHEEVALRRVTEDAPR